MSRRLIARRNFLKGSLLAAARGALPLRAGAASADPAGARVPGGVIDTNVHLFGWPYRNLKYGDTERMVAKLRQHGVTQAWAGSFEGLLHRDIDGVNRRLLAACERQRGFLLPFGTVNPAWPEWEEDLRRCQEEYQMPGIRLHPSHQGYTLSHPSVRRLLTFATERRLMVQIAVELEDERVHHPQLVAPDVDVGPLPALIRDLPQARIQLLNALQAVRGERLKPLLECPQVRFDLANLDGAGVLQKVLYAPSGARDRMPADRLLFGSHVPYFPIQNALFKFMESQLRGSDLKALLSENASRFLTATSV
jgi:uncharacterized protein